MACAGAKKLLIMMQLKDSMIKVYYSDLENFDDHP
jgi:hypothetical protein